MERLTDWLSDDKTEVSIRHDGFRDAMIRLATYEDTGLTPEEIMDGKMLTDWIPVAERLPDQNMEVYALIESRNGVKAKSSIKE